MLQIQAYRDAAAAVLNEPPAANMTVTTTEAESQDSLSEK